MIPAHRIETVLLEDGKLFLDELPYRTGQAVEIIVLSVNRSVAVDATMRGKVVRFDRPTDPVAENDWAAMQ